MNNRIQIVFGALVLAGVIASMMLFTVDQRQHAVVFQLGEVKEVISEPGLNWKLPLIQNVRFFDRRILTIDTPEPERFITADRKSVV